MIGPGSAAGRGAASPSAATAFGTGRPGAAHAALRELDGRTVAFFSVASPSAVDPDGIHEAGNVERALRLAVELQIPAVGLVHSVGVEPRSMDGLTAWGRVARQAVQASGVVPLLLAVTGPCHGGLVTLLGLADHVVFTRDATAFINGPAAVATVTGLRLHPAELGGPHTHAEQSGLATLLVADEADAIEALTDLLALFPDNSGTRPTPTWCNDPAERPSILAAATVPEASKQAYDVRQVIDDIVDVGSFLEVHAEHATNLVTAYGRFGGRPVAIVANQPSRRAGTIDIKASSKAARHVQLADSANLGILTLVDTPGYEPGRDLEWQGIIRHGAELVHAYASATVPRVCLVLRKSYGGAYIVMDSRTMGSDLVLCWPSAEIAVMGAAGAVAILNRAEIAAADDPGALRARLEDEYRSQFCTPRIAVERGLVDEVIDPVDTRAHLVAAFRRLATKRTATSARRHSNTPL